MAELKKRFLEYAAFGKPGAKDMTSKNFAKLCKEKKLMDKKLNSTEVDMIFTRAKGGPGNKTLTFDTFQTALKMAAKSKYGDDGDENVKKLKDCICCGEGGPSTAGTTKTSTKGNVDHFTDASKYTGSHKERFDDSGKGKGKAGRDDLAAQTGYVSGYKEKDTYDKTHCK
ncbi:tubulin polymerization-promoting protein family member 2-like [Amphiura filiformis]|uniref:tubulin polymerization-promoting protein family member 2-like n=1 Tax=Amphiura filiformis TaxID=82378 RepID=UPI003B20B625